MGTAHACTTAVINLLAEHAPILSIPDGRPLRISPVLPGRAHDLTSARAHRIIRINKLTAWHGIALL